MRTKPFRRAGTVLVSAAVVLGGAALASSSATAQPSQPSWHHTRGIQHVLLISVDGMHQSDLEWYVAHHPHSELARLATGGAEFGICGRCGSSTPVCFPAFTGSGRPSAGSSRPMRGDLP